MFFKMLIRVTFVSSNVVEDARHFVARSQDESVGGVDEETGNGGVDVRNVSFLFSRRRLIHRQLGQGGHSQTPTKDQRMKIRTPWKVEERFNVSVVFPSSNDHRFTLTCRLGRERISC